MGREAKLKAVDKPTPQSSVAPPSLLEPSEIAYQTSLLARIRREQSEHQALLRYWTEFLSQKYQLGREDRIEESGRIVRVPDSPDKSEPEPSKKEPA